MKIIGHDLLGKPIRKTKNNKYLWKAENNFYELRERSEFPYKLGKLICYFKGFPKHI